MQIGRLEKAKRFGWVGCVLLTVAGCTQTGLIADSAKSCFNCDEWNQPQTPFQIFANSYYVGTAGLSSILITSNQGHVLIDGGLTQSAPLIAENIATLGFDLSDVKLLVSSHAHYDHVGGLSALAKASQATIAASPASAEALKLGSPTADDPQYGFGEAANRFPKTSDIQVISDRQTLRVGDTAITAHFTPGHTAGGTTWSWRACGSERCANIVYADSISAVSAPEFRFSQSESQRVNAETLQRSIETVRQLPCDIFLAPHPFYFDLAGKVANANPSGSNPFLQPNGCRDYADRANDQLKKRLATERTSSNQ